MLIFHDLSRKSEYPTVAALGFFDGVHLGHRAVIAEAVKQARAQNGKGAVFTFEPPHHTDRAVSKSDVKLLQSPENRDRVMEELGVELVLCPPFESFYNFSPEEFVREILKNCLNCRGVVCGEDYRFGKKGAGNVALLRELAAEGAVDGIEVYHPSNSPEDSAECLALCKQYGLVATAGTDFHGRNHKHPHPIGTCTAPDEAAAQLRAIAEKRKRERT